MVGPKGFIHSERRDSDTLHHLVNTPYLKDVGVFGGGLGVRGSTGWAGWFQSQKSAGTKD